MIQQELLRVLAKATDMGDDVARVQLCDLLEEIGDPRSKRIREGANLVHKRLQRVCCSTCGGYIGDEHPDGSRMCYHICWKDIPPEQFTPPLLTPESK